MQKIKFDFEATKERIYAPNSNVPIGAPVDRNGNIANDGNAYGIVLCKETENEKYWVKYNLVVMVAGYCDIIDAQAIWGDEYSAEAIAAMSDIVFCDNHKIGGGGGMMAAHIIYNEDDDTYSCDKTFDEIKSALPFVILVDADGCIGYSVDSFEHEIRFFRFYAGTTQSGDDAKINALYYTTFSVMSDNTVEYIEFEKTFE